MRPRKYTERTLEKAVEAYFCSISREIPAMDRVDSGERDAYGHAILKEIPITNRLGEKINLIEYIVPPSVGGLCDFLQIHRSTWAEYCNPDLHPEFSDTTTRARERMRAWREEQLLTRKDVRGIIFDLQNNYGYSEKHQMELGERAEKAVTAVTSMTMAEKLEALREAAREFMTDGESSD